MSKVEIVIVGRDTASPAFASAGKALSSLGNVATHEGGRLKSFFTNAFAFATGGLITAAISTVGRSVKGFFEGAIQESRDAAHGLAQTEAAIKSTGGAAGVTTKQIVDLAGSLSHTTLQTDDSVQSLENLLLTFTGVKNAVGEGNDIFTQATKIGLDMAQALGGDATQSAIQLGKALNDPVAGISALTRVGVTFTAQQKEQIKTLQASGDTLGAQKVILAELTKEFGGSASAAAKADGGFHLFQQRMDDVKQSIGDRLQPALTALMTYMSGPGLDAVQGLADTFGGALSTAVTWLTTTGLPATITGFSGLWNSVKVLVTGDFSGGIFGLDEDSGFVRFLLKVHEIGADAFKIIKDGIAGLASGDMSQLKIDVTTIFGSDAGAGITDTLQRIREGWGLARDAAITFVQALQGDWVNTSGILPLHQAVGDFGLLVHDVFGWLVDTGLPDLKASFDAAMPGNIQLVKDMTTALSDLSGQSTTTTTDIAANLNAWTTPLAGPALALNNIATAFDNAGFEIHLILVQAGADWLVFQGQVVNIATSIGAAFTSFGSAMSNMGTQIGLGAEFAGGKFSAAWETASTAVSLAWLRLTTAVTVANASIVTAITGIETRVGTMATNVYTAVTGAATLAWSTFYNAVQTANTNAVNAISGIETAVGTMASTVKAKIDEAVGFFTGLPGRVTAAVGNLGGVLVTAGSDLVGGLIAGITSKFAAVQSTLSSLTKLLPSWKGPPATDAALLFDSGKLIIQGLINGFSTMTPAVQAKLKSITDMIGSTFDAGSKGVDFFGKLVDFKAPDAASITAFTAATTAIVSALGTAAQAFKAKWLEQAGVFMDAASKGLGVLSAGIDGLTKLSTFRAPSVAAVNDFTDTVLLIVQSLGTAATIFKDDWLTHAQVFLDTAGKGLSIIGSGVDGIAKLIDFKAPSITAVNAFSDTVLVLIQSLGTAAQAFEDGWLAQASRFEDTASKGLALLGSGIDGLLKLTDFKAPSIAAINAFGDTVTALVQQLGTVAQVFKAEWLAQAGVFADAAAKGIGIIGSGIDGFLKLSSYVGIAPNVLNAFAADLQRVVQKMIDMAQSLNVEGVAAAAVFGDAVGKIIAPIANAITTFTDLNKYKGVLPAAVQLIGEDIAGVVGFLGVIAEQANTAGVAAAVAFSASVGTIFAGLKSGLDVLTALGNYKGVASAKVQELVDDILEIVKMTGTLAYQAGAAESASLDWQNHLAAYHDRIVAGLNSIATLNGLTATATIHAQTRIVEDGGVGGPGTPAPGAPAPPPSPGIKFDRSSPPHAAAGVRNFAGGLIEIGEQGREWLRLPRGSDVYTESQVRNLAASRGTQGADAAQTQTAASVAVTATLPATSLDPIVGAIQGAIYQAAVAIVTAIQTQKSDGNYQQLSAQFGTN